jgi:hypothetical protein
MPLLPSLLAVGGGDTTVTVIWGTIIALLLIVGFFGTFMPVLPGTTLILAGVLVHYFALGRENSGLGWPGLVVIGLLFLASLVVDWLSGALGAKWFGSSKWGVLGAVIGGIVGLFFGIPGLIVGPILGVFLFEMLLGKKQVKDASNSTLGTVVGGLAGIVVRVAIALVMILWYVGDVFVIN